MEKRWSRGGEEDNREWKKKGVIRRSIIRKGGVENRGKESDRYQQGKEKGEGNKGV